jgi:hypothetical protein
LVASKEEAMREYKWEVNIKMVLMEMCYEMWGLD